MAVIEMLLQRANDYIVIITHADPWSTLCTESKKTQSGFLLIKKPQLLIAQIK